MATRTLTGTILKANGSPWMGAEVRFTLLDDTFTVSPDESFPINTVTAASDDAGEISVSLVSGLDQAYRVTTPDRETFDIVVPDGGTTTLEALRAAYAGPPVPIDTVEAALTGLLPSANILSVHNVTHYGAVGDGATNDAVAFRAAVAAAHVDGNPVYVPAGIYLLDEVVNSETEILRFTRPLKFYSDAGAVLATLVIGSNVDTDCDVIRYDPDYATPPSGSPDGSAEQPRFFEIEGLRIVAQTNGIAKNGIVLVGSDTDPLGYSFKVRIARCWIGYPSKEFSGRAITVEDSQFNGAPGTPTNSPACLEIVDCHIWGGIQLVGGGDSLRVTNNVLSGSNVAVEVDMTSGAANFIMAKNNVTSTGGGLWLKRAIHASIEQNYFEATAAITGGSGTTSYLDLDGNSGALAAGVRVVDNQISLLIAAGTCDGIRIEHCSNVLIDNNQFATNAAGQVAVRTVAGGNKVRIGHNWDMGGVGTLYNISATAPHEVVFNDEGINLDYRFEGDTDPQLLMLDASADKVGVGTLIPTAKLDVANIPSGITALRMRGNADGNAFFQAIDAGATVIWGQIAITSGSIILTHPNGHLIGLDDAVTINDTGADRDTRIEGDTDVNLLFVDASADSVAIGNNAPTSWFDLKAGTTARAPLRIPAGTNLTTPLAGVAEFDGAQLFWTNNTTDKRGDIPVEKEVYLASDGGAIGATIADFFGANKAFDLPASSRWELEADLYFLKSTAGTVTLTITNSAANWTSFSGHYLMPPVGGVGAVGVPQTAGLVNTTTAAAAFPASGSLTDATTHYMKARATFQMNAAGNVRIRFTESAGTVTPQADSFVKLRRIPVTDTGGLVT